MGDGEGLARLLAGAREARMAAGPALDRTEPPDPMLAGVKGLGEASDPGSERTG
jgi:hypothetical protein